MKNCDRGRGPRAAFSSPRSQFFTIQTDPKPVNNLFIFFQALKRKKKLTRYCDRSQRYQNPIVGFVTVPSWKKINKSSHMMDILGLCGLYAW